MNAYKLAISEVAEKIPVGLLINEFKNKLFTENCYDPETHDIYRIPIGVNFITLKNN